MQEYERPEVAEDFAENMIKWPQSVADVIISYIVENNRGLTPAGGEQFDLMLDAGCASGASTRLFSPYFRSVIGFDINESQIAKASDIGGAPNVTYVVATGESMPASNNSVDLVTNAFAVQYMDLDKFVCECRRVLKDKGCAVLYGCDYSELRRDPPFGESVNCDVSGIDMLYKHYIRPLEAYLIEIGHPDQNAFNRFAPIYEGIKGMKKERRDDITFECKFTLQSLKSMFLSVPIFQQFQDTFKGSDSDPLQVFCKKVKTLWGIPQLRDDQVHVRLTVSVFMIFLTN